MIEDTKRFYEKTKLEKGSEDKVENVEDPISWIHVFYKEYPRLPSIDLPKLENSDNQLETLLKMRESTRVFSDSPLKLEEIARVLRSCRIVDSKRIPEIRTYPSGGARFPIEIYFISFNINGLNLGAYHYNIKREKLELLLDQDLRVRRRELISPYLDNPAAAIIFTSVISRSEVKYGAKAYQLSLIEAGHMAQNVHLVCTDLGIGSCSVSCFVNDSVAELLDLTETEIPIYVVGVGKKIKTHEKI